MATTVLIIATLGALGGFWIGLGAYVIATIISMIIGFNFGAAAGICSALVLYFFLAAREGVI